MRARLDARKRLGLYGPLPAGPSRPGRVHPPVAASRLVRLVAPAVPLGIGRAPDTPSWNSGRDPYRRGVAA
ncbi:hypothetical protein [Sphaerisporangium sp. NPDC051011]|uniref:hypothetical protein n=1 Tax=Sphaerisporangium sp. NPDC051011 TaxID=3155792 RepID=UPI0033CAD63F